MTLLGSWYYAGGGDDAGADSGAHPGGNGHGCGQNPWITTPTPPPGNLRSWFPIVVVSHLLISFVSSTALTAPSSVGRNGGGDGNKQRSGDVSKKDLADAPSTSNDMNVIICEGL